MSSTRQPDVLAVLDGFHEARGSADDRAWAERAYACLFREDVRSAAAARALDQALDLVRESGEAPGELYGSADEWAADQRARWVEEGVDVTDDTGAQLRDVPLVASVGAVVLTLLLGVVHALSGDWQVTYTVGLITMPFTVSAAALLGLWTYERLLRRRRAAVAAAVGTVLVCAVAIALVFAVGNPHPVAQASVLWLVPLAAGYAGLAWVLGRAVPDRPAAVISSRRRLPDDDWTAELARLLRSRGDVTEDRVRTITEEARAHAAQAGSTLDEEFGAPGAYAQRIARNPRVRARRGVVARLALLGIWVWLLLDAGLGGASAWTIGWRSLLLLILVVEAARVCWRYRELVRSGPVSDR
ncbi:hypothetical protein ADJ73_02155 [Arsenicicoccus sp. oral taxon 190]|nr:hypothetical protein ADJ73_02155 [Arsenicicoccus sp. oral taxon 190]